MARGCIMSFPPIRRTWFPVGTPSHDPHGWPPVIPALLSAISICRPDEPSTRIARAVAIFEYHLTAVRLKTPDAFRGPDGFRAGRSHAECRKRLADEASNPGQQGC